MERRGRRRNDFCTLTEESFRFCIFFMRSVIGDRCAGDNISYQGRGGREEDE